MPKFKYGIKRVVAAGLCAGVLFTDFANGISVSAGKRDIVFAKEVWPEEEDFYLHGSGGNITEGELPYELELPAAKSRIAAYVMSVSNYTTSQAGIDAIKVSEGIPPFDSDGLTRAYDDMQPSVVLQETTPIKGTLTIGYGHTGSVNGKPIAWDTRLTAEEAELLLKSDVAVFEKAVNDFCNTYGIALTQYQFDALVCFTFNLGTGWTTRDSSMALMLRNGYEKYSEDEIINIFCLYKYSANILMPGLVQRRRREAAMFLNNAALENYKTGNYQVESNGLAVRSSAGLTSPQIATLNKGTQIAVINVSGVWGQTSSGWVHLGYCCYLPEETKVPSEPETPTTPETPTEPETPAAPETPAEPETPATPEKPAEPETPKEENYPTGFYEITTPLNIRSGPGTSYKQVGGTVVGQVVRVTKTSGKWGKISKGWISLNPLYSRTYKPKKPVVSTKSNITEGVKLGWNKVDKADGYYVYRKVGSEGYQKLATQKATETTYTDTTAQNGETYKYKVFAYRKIDGAVCKSSASSVKTITRLKGTSTTSVNSNVAKKLNLSWKKDTAATGYELQYAGSSTFAAKETKTLTVKSNKTTEKVLSGLPSGKKYYIRIRTYKVVEEKTYRSSWSKTVSVIVR